MSLKIFHILFLTLSALLSLGLAVLGPGLVPEDRAWLGRSLTLVGVVGLVGLSIYGNHFLRTVYRNDNESSGEET